MEIHSSRAWSWTDWFMVGLRVFGFFMILVTFVFGNETIADKLGIVLAFAVLALALPQLFYLPGHIRPKLFIISELIISVAFTAYLISNMPDTNAKSYLFLPIFIVSYLYSQRSYYWLGPSLIIVLALALFLFTGETVSIAINFAINLALFSAFGFCLGMFLKQKTQLSRSYKIIEEKNIALEHAIKQVERLTLLEERNRMARELHDTVGHSLTASIVAMEAVQTLIDRNTEASKQRLQQVIDFSRNHLGSFRRTVHDMAMSELKQPLIELLTTAANEFSSQTSTKVVLDVSGESDVGVSEAIKLSFLRCLQESMTNAKKHGNATEITITLNQRRDMLSLTVQDNGSGSDELTDGFGIEGMKARAEVLRGTLNVISKKGEGTTVYCDIPIGV